MSIYEQDAKDIIRFLKTGDAMACNNLVDRHQKAVFGICVGILKNEPLAQEVAQDVLLKAFEKLKKLEDPKKFRAWVIRMAYNASIDIRRKKKHYLDRIDEKNHIQDKSISIEDKMDQDKKRELILNQIHELGNPDSSIFILFYMENMTTEEISNALGLTKSNVKIKLMRGREKLKNKLKTLLNDF